MHRVGQLWVPVDNPRSDKELRKKKKKKKKKKTRVENHIHSYSNCVYLLGYYSNCVYLQTYIPIDVGSFVRKMCKFDNFLLYTHIGVIALNYIMTHTKRYS